MKVLEGGCLCGAVRYRLFAAPSAVFYCHCRMCQKHAGGPFLAFLTLAADAVQWAGEPAVWRSSDIAVRAHCGACGTPLYWQGDDLKDEFDIALATLDEPDAFPPREHLWTESARAWPVIEDGLPRHARERDGSG
ncbi:GFA family protein [Minwuia thermotolerans]|uniref:GFA family protein n=1 Tax=Minwuia thermotolerans TaxID=2056226 RepID=A0A2M9FXN0_9PROT|nr:GFA family protein [Minwuia thermotolerans]PJK28213.1 GFA family protein [Minwuia thermotolerans]